MGERVVELSQFFVPIDLNITTYRQLYERTYKKLQRLKGNKRNFMHLNNRMFDCNSLTLYFGAYED